jgi:hypothetical protein
MSEARWHERLSTLEEERKFKKLLVLHSLTRHWTESFSTKDDESSFRIERMPRLTLKQNLWLLEKTRLDEILTELDSLVAEQNVSEFLAELYETIWIIQISTLENAFAETKDEGLLLNLLKNSSWNHGKKTAEAEWLNLKVENLNSAYQAFLETHADGPSGFLLGRSAHSELNFYWVKSPNQNPAIRDSERIETFCLLHQEWLSGFFYGICRKIQTRSEKSMIENRNFIDFTLLWTY